MNKFNTHINHKKLIRIFQIVREYISKKELILYGGMAIDYALKSRNHIGIYTDDIMPDYDFYSSDIITEGVNLVNLIKKEFDDILFFASAHLTGITLKYYDIDIADISFMPEEIQSIIPTLKYNNLTIVHPRWQKMDMYRSFSIPYYGFPRENVYHRFLKDNLRLIEFDKVFPDKGKRIGSKKKLLLNRELSRNNLVSGIFAYAIIYKYAQSMIEIPDTILKATIKMGNIIECEFESDIEWTAEIVSSNYERMCSDIKNIKHFSPFLDDILPKSIVGKFKNNEVCVYFPNSPITKFRTKYGMDIVSVQVLLCQLLGHSYKSSSIYYNYYCSLKELIKLIDESTVPDMEDVKNYPFYISADPYGNYDIYQKIKLLNLDKKIMNKEVKNFRVQPERYTSTSSLRENDGYVKDLILFKQNQVLLKDFNEYP